MKLSLKKRFALGAAAVATVGAVATLAAGVTFGFFSAAGTSAPNSFTAGTVSIGSPSTTPCTVTNVVPGDATAGWVSLNSTGTVDTDNTASEIQCVDTVQYTGNVNAYLGLDVKTTGSLYDATANGLQLLITSTNPTDSTTYVNGASLAADATTSNMLVITVPFTHDQSVTVDVDYFLPTTAGNAYQGATSNVNLTIHAAQSSNNPVGGTAAINGAVATDITW